VKLGLGLVSLAGVGFLVFQVLALLHTGFAPQANAYSSLYHVMHWVLCFTVVAALGTNFAAQVRVWKEGTDPTGYVALQMERSSIVWYYAVAAAVVIYLVVYVSPHF
jgi:hypothetical protein